MQKMEHLSSRCKTDAIDKLTVGKFSKDFLTDKSAVNPILENILSEGGETFLQYIDWIGLTREPNMMVLSSMKHYYYDHDDLKDIRALINLKGLNNIRHLDSFLHTLYRILPSGAYFTGCFKPDHKGRKVINYYASPKVIRGLINILDPAIERSLTKLTAKKLLEENGFEVLDITELNGLAYFFARSKRQPC